MKIAIILTTVCLLVIIFFLLQRLHLIKRNLKSFTKEVKSLNDDSYKQPIKVESYDKEIVSLANALNEHIENERKLMLKYLSDKRELSNIVSGISHDFRTPLTASLGYLQMIQKSGELSSEAGEYLSIAIEKNIYLKELSDDFFEISKYDSNCNDETELEEVNISNLITEQLLYQYEWIEKQRIKTEIDIQDAIVIHSDTHLLTRIIQNLFTNANKYTNTYLGVKLYTKNSRTILEIYNDATDTNAIDTDKMFDAFYRSASRSKSGSGLGLYICKRLAQQLGAQISANKNGNEIKLTLVI